MLSDLSIRRPVLATVLSLLVIVAGLIAFRTLPLRELPDVDRPIVSVDVGYRGASAQVMETQVTRQIEDALSGIEGIDTISSNSRDGRASVNIEFDLGRDLDAAANDVRAAVDRIRAALPSDVDDPVITKTDADADPFIWFSLESSTLDRVALTDFAERQIVDQLSVIDGVASVRVGGGLRPALRIWLDPNQLAARSLTVDDIERALRAQNVELPAGAVEAQERDYQIRTARLYQTPEEFARLPVTRPGQSTGAVVRLGDVARVEIAPEESRRLFRGNGVDQIGLGIVRQSRSNALDVGNAVKAELERLRPSLPEGTNVVVSFDSTVFIEAAIEAVWKTLAEATVLVIIVIFLFLGSFRAALIPAAVIPVSLIGAFAVLSALGFSINLLTLLGLVLAIGLVVDDSIVVLENAQRRIDTLDEARAVAALRGTRQVFFAVLATSAVVIAVFTPFFFLGGYVGKLFVELAVTVAAAILISTFVALTLSPMMASKMLRPVEPGRGLSGVMDRVLGAVRAGYRVTLAGALESKIWVFVLLAAVIGVGAFAFLRLPSELTPPEDRGNLFVVIDGPEGAGFAYTSRVLEQVEDVFLTYVDTGEVRRVLIIAPSFGDSGTSRFSSGFARVFLADWGARRHGDEIVGELNRRFGELPGATVRVIMQNPFAARGGGAGASIVLLGSNYDELAAAGDRVVASARQNPIFIRPRMDFEPNAARVLVHVDRERAAALGVTVQSVARALEATMGQRRLNTFERDGEEYNIYIQAERDQRSEIDDLAHMYVRSDRTGELVALASVVTAETVGDTSSRRRFDRLAAVTVSVSLPPGVPIGTAISELARLAGDATQGQNVRVDFTGEAREFREARGQILFAFLFALVIVFLVLAAQFESFVNPFIIMLSVPLAVAGGLLGLYLVGSSLNIYSQIGLIILIALAAKNGILIVEFANQLRDEGRTIREAILEACDLRLRPVLMTSIATIIGAMPLMLADGAGAESRQTIGVVIVFGLLISTLLTLYIVPAFYDLLARFTRSPEATGRLIDEIGQTQRGAAE
ncbi:MAG: efflux RND transporter permease subunit [Alphaproteobacteria bacterium]|nr:efflux RND transporter permease subunit [Alphaproteobacteria bacterium]